MKVCFYGNTGHFFTAFVAKDRLEDIEFAAYCPGYQGEDCCSLQARRKADIRMDGRSMHVTAEKRNHVL